jgi:competence protein ComEC
MARPPKRASLITAFGVAFLVGLWLGHLWWQTDIYLVLAAGPVVAVARKSRLCIVAILLSGLTLGVWRGYGSNFTYTAIDALKYQKVTLEGSVLDDPVVTDRGSLKFNLGQLSHQGEKIPGEVRVTSHYAKLSRGYRVEATGRLYPTVGNKQASFGFASVRSLGDQADALEVIRRRFAWGMRNALPEPLSSLALGLLMGTRSQIPPDLQAQLTTVGLTHLVAVSGYNLTILAEATYKPLRRHSRRLATLLTLGLVIGFCAITGFSASIVRAAVVAGLSLLVAYYGRSVKPLALLALTAAITTWVKPEYLWSDLGWQLSFLAFFGILVLAPAAEARWVRRPNAVKSLLIQSLAAQAMTAPLIMAVFGRASTIAPLANVLVLPLIPGAMLLGFVAGLAGLLMPTLSGWLAWPALLWLHLITQIIAWLSTLGGESHWYPNPRFMAGLYLLLAFWPLLLRERQRQTKPAS